MYQIMIISEKQTIARQIISYLEEEPECQLHVVLSGYHAAVRFEKIKPDVLFLDTQIMVPYPFVIEELEQFQWHYNLILVGPDDQSLPELIPTVQIPYEQLNREYVLNVIHSLTIEQPSSVQNTPVISEQYHVLAVLPAQQDVGDGNEIARRMKNRIEPYAGCLIQSKHGRGAAAMVQRASVTVGMELHKLAGILLQEFGPNAVILYESNIHWSDLQSRWQHLLGCQDIAYFLRGQCADLSATGQREPMERAALQYTVSKLAEASLSGRSGTADRLLQTLYLRVLKQSMDRAACRYTAFLLFQLYRIEAQILHLPVGQTESEGQYIEDDWAIQQTMVSYYINKMAQIRLSQPVCKSIVMMFAQYEKSLYLSGVAEELNLSSIYLSRIFREQTGMTFLQMLQQLRMAAANYFLRETDANISQIAALVGYSDPNYFGRRYKQLFSITPLQAKRQSMREVDVDESVLQQFEKEPTGGSGASGADGGRARRR